MYEWPDALVQEVAERRVIFVLGAGASMASRSANGRVPPSWTSLLQALLDKIQNPKSKRLAQGLISRGQLLDAAEIIHSDIDQNEFSRIVREQLLNPGFEPANIHKNILNIDPKILITTNYDKIYERLFSSSSEESGHNVCRYHDDHLLNDVRSSTRCVVKMHGCVSDPARIVLSRSGYFKSRRDYSHFFKVIDSLLITNTFIFVGSSMSDPDIQLMLENSNINTKCEHAHYAIMSNKIHPALVDAMKNNYNIKVIKFRDGKYQEVDLLIQSLAERVKFWRISRGSS